MMKTVWMTMLVLGVFCAVVGCDSKKSTASKRRAAGAKELTLDLGNKETMKLVLIPAGKFLMGSPETEKDRHESETQHEVTISKPFYMGQYEVTQAQWEALMGPKPPNFEGGNRPVQCVSWQESQEFCKKLSAKAGCTVRLPTEAEWEYACRAGTKTQYYFGDDASQLGQYAWYKDNSGEQTHDVGGKLPNPWGLYDMHGNLCEWCQDWSADYPAGPQTDPKGPSYGIERPGGGGTIRVLRGGSGDEDASRCRAAGRSGYLPTYRVAFHGFRVAMDAE
jgi:formylglycine-generating enzyme required for sulfatase activity